MENEILNPNVKAEYKDCNECPKEYCVKQYEHGGNTILHGKNFFIIPKCFEGKGGQSFKLYFDYLNKVKGSPPKIRHRKTLLKSVSYILNNYKELALEDCLNLIKIKHKCNELNELNGGVAMKRT